MYFVQRSSSQLDKLESLREFLSDFHILTSVLNCVKESNDISGSKGEANFVWRCKSCKVRRSQRNMKACIAH